MSAMACVNATGNDTITATMVRNDFLTLDGLPVEKFSNAITFEWTLDWLPYLNKSDYLILNSGRHYKPLEEYLPSLNATFSWLEKHLNPAVPKFFMSSKIESYGREVLANDEIGQRSKGMHYYHGDYTLHNMCYTNNSTAEVPYNIREVEEANGKAKSLILKNFPSIQYLDYSCLDLHNSYGYKDDAHSCMPGPIDYRSYVFMQKLLGT